MRPTRRTNPDPFPPVIDSNSGEAKVPSGGALALLRGGRGLGSTSVAALLAPRGTMQCKVSSWPDERGCVHQRRRWCSCNVAGGQLIVGLQMYLVHVIRLNRPAWGRLAHHKATKYIRLGTQAGTPSPTFALIIIGVPRAAGRETSPSNDVDSHAYPHLQPPPQAALFSNSKS
ncbi:hypothetical protein BU16DRAFT_567002 [Lophium mytilinum]|uniref:Uncharacterized protein n=1 Tax=Lophium mytilinum TaxID=390894 RepID=A0A6A6QBY3_9PEZI|nr:hypothetical protein BU16DRAFT_567002 [Lophium mytilinum]